MRTRRWRTDCLCVRSLHGRHDGVKRHLFAEEVLDAQLPGLILQIIRPPIRQDHHGGLRVDLSHLSEHFDAVNIRQPKVQQGEARPSLLK